MCNSAISSFPGFAAALPPPPRADSRSLGHQINRPVTECIFVTVTTRDAAENGTFHFRVTFAVCAGFTRSFGADSGADYPPSEPMKI